MHTILIAHDDPHLVGSLTTPLSSRFRVLTAHSGTAVIQILNEESVGVVIADYALKDKSGLELVQFVSVFRPRPPIILLAKYVDKDIAMGCLNSGVFGIIEHPFAFTDIQSNIERAFAHFLPPDSSRDSVIELAPDALEISFAERRIKLTATEFEIFSMLYASRGQWVSRNHLEHVVYQGRHVSRNLLDTHVSNLRKKVPELKTRIQALRGRGYVFRHE